MLYYLLKIILFWQLVVTDVFTPVVMSCILDSLHILCNVICINHGLLKLTEKKKKRVADDNTGTVQGSTSRLRLTFLESLFMTKTKRRFGEYIKLPCRFTFLFRWTTIYKYNLDPWFDAHECSLPLFQLSLSFSSLSHTLSLSLTHTVTLLMSLNI